jgi:predicted phosphoribosyltransferase/predicted alpha/beta-hydrolase family hydrolase
MVSLPFRDRQDAAKRLAVALAKYRGSRPLVMAIPRGAVPMGRAIADALDGDLDVVLVRKLGAPHHPEFAIGSVDEQGTVVLTEYAAQSGADAAYVRRESERELQVIKERREHYSPNQAAIPISGRIVIVVDDGLATGSTMIAALKAIRAQGPARLVCAVPVAARDSLDQVAKFADEVICLATPQPFYAVSPYYRDFSAVTDAEVMQILSARAAASSRGDDSGAGFARQVRIPIGELILEGDLTFPPSARGLVIFAHGSGSSRHSSRNRFVASALNRRGFATLLFDLLTAQEDRDVATRFDIPLLARRLESALQWTRDEPELRNLSVGLFGASTGAAAAIIVAAARPADTAAVVSRGGRPDLAGEHALSRVRSHTQLIVGGADVQVLELNRAAEAAIGEWAELVVVPGATHLFEEPGALEQVASIAADWFDRWLPRDYMQARGAPTSLGIGSRR